MIILFLAISDWLQSTGQANCKDPFFASAEDYNIMRPHEALGNISLLAYREKNNKTENTLSALRSALAKPSLHSAR